MPQQPGSHRTDTGRPWEERNGETLLLGSSTVRGGSGNMSLAGRRKYLNLEPSVFWAHR